MGHSVAMCVACSYKKAAELSGFAERLATYSRKFKKTSKYISSQLMVIRGRQRERDRHQRDTEDRFRERERERERERGEKKRES